MYYVYVFLSERDNKFYTGFTEDLKRRVTEHNAGKVQSTAYRRPLRLIYYEACIDKNDAIKGEKYLKAHYGKMFLNKRLKSYLKE